MRFTIFIVVALAGAIAVSAAFATEAKTHECEQCGMTWEVSSTRLIDSVKVEDDSTDHYYESLGCLFNAVEDESEAIDAQVLDYSTFGTDDEALIAADEAVYLFDTKPLPGSMGPFIAAFSSEEAATKAQKKLGGELLDFDGVWEGMAAGNADSAGECNCPGCQAAREGK
jgi:transcription elongation factor Elf1